MRWDSAGTTRIDPYLTGQLNTAKRCEKNEAPAWDREPRRVRFVVSVVFTPTRGVIHPSFPLRGRWERIAKSGEQAPSPSLASLLNSSCETHSCGSLMHGLRQSPQEIELSPSHLLTNTWLRQRIPERRQVRPTKPLWNSPKLIRERCILRLVLRPHLAVGKPVPGPQ